jgi:hypothetical protein
MVAAITSETVVIERNSPGTVKLMRFLAAAPGGANFVDQWQSHYGDAIRASAELSVLPTKYVQNWSTPRASNPFPLARDFVGVDEIWFDTLDDLRSFVALERPLVEALKDAGVIDTTASVTFTAREKRVLP